MGEPINRAWDLIQLSIAQFIFNLPGLIVAAIVFYAIYRSARPISELVRKALLRAHRSQSVILLLTRLTRWSVIVAGFLIAAVIVLPGFNPEELISVLGVGSVAIGFAFRDIFENFLAGMLILLTEPFRIGDQIITGSYEGTIDNIEIRATTLRTYDNRRVVIPNSKLFTDSVIVNTAFPNRRSEYDVAISYKDNIEAAQQLCLEVMNSIEGVLDIPAPDTVMMEMGDSAVIFRVRWWTDSRKSEVMQIQDKVLRTIKNRLTQEGFDIPFPIRTVHFTDMTEHKAEHEG